MRFNEEVVIGLPDEDGDFEGYAALYQNEDGQWVFDTSGTGVITEDQLIELGRMTMAAVEFVKLRNEFAQGLTGMDSEWRDPDLEPKTVLDQGVANG